MAEELHDLITFGEVHIERRGGWQRSSRGDILEGNVLMNAGKSYLIPVFETLTDGYLRYGIHRPTDQAFAEASQGYEYVPRQAPFRLEIPIANRRETVPGTERRPRRIIVGPSPTPAAPVAAPVAAPPSGNRVSLTPQTRLRFIRGEIEGLPLDAVLELRIKNSGTNTDPRRIDVLFRCRVREFQTFFDLRQDRDWNVNGVHSWPRFPRWAEAYVVQGRIEA